MKYSVLRTLFVFTLLSTGILLVTPNTLANESSCNDVLFLFLRGSGQRAASDDKEDESREFKDQDEGREYKENLEKALPEEIQLRSESLNYPAFGGENFKLAWADFDIGLKNGSYWTSKQRGSEMLANRITDEVVSCPHQQVVLAGYSQGAHVVGDALDNLSELQARNTTFISLFGDPRFNPDSFAAKGTYQKKLYGRSGGVLEQRQEFLNTYKGRLESWCLHNDGFCENRVSAIIDKAKSAHGKYATEGWVKSSAIRAAKQVTDKFNQQNGLSLENRRTPKSNQQVDIAFVLPDSTDSAYSRKYFLNNIDDIFSHPAVKTDSARFATVMANNIYHKDNTHTWHDNDTRILSPLSSYNDFKFDLKSYNTPSDAGGKTTLSPLATGVDMATKELDWRDSADKHIVILTDRDSSPTDTRTDQSYQAIVENAQQQGITIHTIAVYTNSNRATATRGWAAGLSSPTEGISSTTSHYYIADSMTSLFDFVDQKPIIVAPSSYTTQLGKKVDLSMAGSYSPSGEQITSFDWDIDDDGIYNKSTLEPKYSYINNKSDDYTIRVRATSSSGKRSTYRIPIYVTEEPLPSQRPPAEPSRVSVKPELEKSEGKWYMILNWLLADKQPVTKISLFDQLKQYLQPRVVAADQSDLPVIAYSLHDESGAMIGIYTAEQRQAKIPLEIAEQNSKLGIASHTDETSSEIVNVDVPKLRIPDGESSDSEDEIIGSENSKNKSVLSDSRSVQSGSGVELDSSANNEQSVSERKQDGHYNDAKGQDRRGKSKDVTKNSEVLASSHFPTDTLSAVAIISGFLISIGLLKQRLS